MKVDVSFTVSWGPTHHESRSFFKTFDVEWAGLPRPGDHIDLDVSPPVSEMELKVGGLSWSIKDSKTWIWLERIELSSLEDVEWQNGFDEYREYLKRNGWGP